ncbi:MAG: flagellar assembly protein FliW [Planctomycetales bacterium]|nr:flagellar assembly protein FliW [Planctomycetales bacterium]
MLVHTTRFGNLEVKQDDVIIFPQGLIGFEANRHWLIVADPENSDVAWLQAVAQAQVALPLVSPRKYAPDYRLSLPQRQLSPLKVRSTDKIFVLTVVSKSGKTLTTNLRSPIVINLTQRLACQVISTEPLPLAMPINLDSATPLRIAA